MYYYCRQPIRQQLQHIESGQDYTLVLRNVQRNHEGNYTCQVRNSLGMDQIIYQILVHVPPGAPKLHIVSTTTNSVTLEWPLDGIPFYNICKSKFVMTNILFSIASKFSFAAIDNGRSPIKGYLLSYRREFGDWDEISLTREANSHTLEDLQCGATYQFTLAAFNKIGSGTASKIENARTKGKKPISPEAYHFIRTNITSVMLDLSAWQDGGCPIQYFTVEFRRVEAAGNGNNDWIVVSSNVQAKSRFSIPDLEPAVVYNLRITAHNNAGVTIAAYIFETLNVNGDVTRGDLLLTSDDALGVDSSDNAIFMQRAFNFDLDIIILVFGSVFGVAAAFVCACYCFRNSKYLCDASLPM